MKTFFFVFALTLSFSAFSEVIEVKGMQRDRDLERSYILKTNLKERTVLDCQSFIQGLRIGEFESAYTFLLDPWECEELQKRVRSSLTKFKRHCIDVEEDIRADYTCQ